MISRYTNASKYSAKAALLVGCLVLAMTGHDAWAQTAIVVETFEYASTDLAAKQGSQDISDSCNRPTFFISGALENASPQEPSGLFSIGTDAVYCINPNCGQCLPGTFIGFRRDVDPALWPMQCPGGASYVPLQFTYGDPDNPGLIPPDELLSALIVRWDVYGDGSFADGLTGTHLWLRLIDCEGEKFEFINFSEVSLYSEIFTFDVDMGQSIIRLAPESLVDVPDGDRLLTEITAIEVIIQDDDSPPTSFGKWYVDYLRVIEPTAPLPGDYDADGDVDLVDHVWLTSCLSGPATSAMGGCDTFDDDGDTDVDLIDLSVFQATFGTGL